MAPRFSVLLPTHNRADVLPFAIKSVLAQTERDFELLIVGDGCTDSTAEVVSGFDDPRIRWFDLPKAPYFGYANRNVALKQARGEFVAYAAHDDLLFPDHLALLAERLEAAGADLVYSRPLMASPDGVVVPLAGNLHNADELETFLGSYNFIAMSCVVHRRAVLEESGYWPEDVAVGADWRLWQRIIERGARRNFTYHPVPTMLHFKAIWMEAFDQTVGALLGLAEAGWWPAALKVAVGSHSSEQAAMSALLDDPASAWVDDVRRAVTLVVERLAWEHTKHCLHRGRELPEEIASLRHLLAYRESQVTGLVDQLKRAIDPVLESASALASPPPEFVERDYLEANPDVAEAVAKGAVKSGFDHWVGWGWRERRPLRRRTPPG
jgi:hypothetical protein